MFMGIKHKTLWNSVHNVANKETVFHDCHHVRVFAVPSFPFALQSVLYQSQPDFLVHI